MAEMRASFIWALMLLCSSAHAQIEIVERNSPDPTPSPSSATPSPSSATPSQVPPSSTPSSLPPSSLSPASTPVRYTDWPTAGYRFRGLPDCGPGETFPAAGSGEPYTCHPPFPPTQGPNLHLLWGFPFGHGYLGAEEHNRALGVEVGFELYLGRVFGLSVGYRYLSIAPKGVDRDGDGYVDLQTPRSGVHVAHGGIRLRFLTDESTRRAWILGVDAGFLGSIRPDATPVGHGMVLQTGFQRQLGWLTPPKSSAVARLGVRYDQGVTASNRAYRALLLTVSGGFEWNYAPPDDFDTLRVPPRQAISVSPSLVIGKPIGRSGVDSVIGVQLAFGLPMASGVVEPLLRVGFDRLTSPLPADEDRRIGATRRLSTGAGFRVRPTRWLHAEVGGGYRTVFGDRPARGASGAYVEGALGSGYTFCGLALQPAVYYRWNHFARGEDFGAHEIGVRLEVDIASSGSAYGGQCGSPPPRANPLVVRPVPAPVPAAQVEAEVVIEVQPIEIEVVVGVVAFGGALQAQIDLSRLPLDRLRDAGFVEVRLIGPPAALPRIEAELRATLDSQGVRMNAVAHAETGGFVQEIKAVFTIWPAGHGPQ